MVITPKPAPSTRAFLILDLVVGLAMLVLAVFPLAYAVNAEARLFRATYQRALAMEIVDGEMEILAAGEWRAFPEGARVYSVHARAAANLPDGRFQLTRTGHHLRLEWSAREKSGVGAVVREVTVP